MANEEFCSLCLDYALGEMRDELMRKRYERHLKNCPTCQKDLFEYREIIQSLHVPDETDAVFEDAIKPAHVIPFPAKLQMSVQPLGLSIKRFSNRAMTFSVSATIAAMTLAVLVHTGHLPHVAVLGDSAWDHVSHRVLMDGSHIRHDLRHL
ncbi:anti-sigma factor family protein [Alicyclobacillus dauci]|uniref:Zinc-finger n=1 Tax=Alicyclobacillus dauci TaxID=1475485 RepID=A0ABY6Z7X4_9BACL|nr:hypothetical protein [Alicyclobacillus dauci]WAH38361.1 hypothetical protein NZD86_07755 [Alicyclobacillus dauci]